jgi:hypothetical protein
MDADCFSKMCSVQEVQVKDKNRTPVHCTCIRDSVVADILMSLGDIYFCPIDLKICLTL